MKSLPAWVPPVLIGMLLAAGVGCVALEAPEAVYVGLLSGAAALATGWVMRPPGTVDPPHADNLVRGDEAGPIPRFSRNPPPRKRLVPTLTPEEQAEAERTGIDPPRRGRS